MAETRDELEQYREKVVAEVERRMMRLREIEDEIERMTFVAEAAARARVALSASTARNQVQAAHRARLKESMKVLHAQRSEAEADLERAEQRLQEVDRRLEELGEEQVD